MNEEAGSESQAGAWYRVRVCMKQVFSDERARALVCVRGGRRVSWLRRRLRARFPLPPRFLLLSAGHLLPPAERLAVLRPDDTVDVVPYRAEDWIFVQPGIPIAPESGVGNFDDFDGATSVRADCDSLRSGFATPDTEHDVIDTGNIGASARKASLASHSSSASPASHDSSTSRLDEELARRKRHALLMLQQYCGQQNESGFARQQYCGEQDAPRPAHNCERDVPPPARPRRRRVRRRRRAAAGPGDAGASLGGAGAGPGSAGAGPGSAGAGPGSADQPGTTSALVVDVRMRNTSVLRNGCERPRQPRVIRPLGDEES